MLDGVDTLHQLTGNAVGDTLTLFIRAGRVGIDILQALLAVTDVFSAISRFKAAWRALGSLKDVLFTELSRVPSESIIATGVGALEALAGFGFDITSDVNALNETLQARYSS